MLLRETSFKIWKTSSFRIPPGEKLKSFEILGEDEAEGAPAGSQLN
jgi:hypothetical protein